MWLLSIEPKENKINEVANYLCNNNFFQKSTTLYQLAEGIGQLSLIKIYKTLEFLKRNELIRNVYLVNAESINNMSSLEFKS